MFRGIIYKYTNKLNEKSYIGQTNNEERRIREHKISRQYNNYFHNAIDKYGWDNFEYEVLIRVFSKTEKNLRFVLDTFEKFYIKKFNTLAPNGYNLTEGGSSGWSSPNKEKKMSEEYCSSVSNSMKNFYKTEKGQKCIERMRKSRKGKGLCKKRSEDTRKRMSEAFKGRIVSNESRDKIRNSLKKFYKDNPELKKDMSSRASLAYKGKHRVYREDGTWYMSF